MSHKLVPLTHEERAKTFGSFKFTHEPKFGNPEFVRIERDWVRSNIREVTLPQLAKLDPHHRITHAVNVHYKAEKPLLALWQAWEDLDLLKHVETWNGLWVPRLKRGFTDPKPQNLSNHAWGTAFDINARKYPLGRPVPSASPMWDLAAVAEQLGFAWGGHFKRRPDGMHFELVQVGPEVAS